MGKDIYESKRFKYAVALLKIACLCLLIGRAWQHFFWTTPYADIFPFNDPLHLKWFNCIIGGIFTLGILVILFYNRNIKWHKLLLYFITVTLFFLAVAYWVTKEYRWTQLFEYSAQVSAIPLLLYLLSNKYNAQRFQIICSIMIAFTFTAHGLYALGFPYTTPAGFIEMTMKILHLNVDHAKLFLGLAGMLDILLTIGLFFKSTQRAALTYAFFWGAITAMARVIAYFDMLSPFSSLHRWLYETIHRAPHAILPLTLLMLSGYLIFSTKKEEIFS